MSGDEVNQNRPVPYADTSAFTRLLGIGSRVKIIDVFLGKHYTTLSIPEIAQFAGLDESTVHRNIQNIIEYGLIEEAGTEGRAQLYRLNKDSKIAQILGRARDELGRESDKIPRPSDRSDFLSASGRPRDIQDSLENYSLEESNGGDEGPRPSDYINISADESVEGFGVEGAADV